MKADNGVAYDKAVRGGGAKLHSLPALKTYLVSANGSYGMEVRSGGTPSSVGSGSKHVPRADGKSCGINVHGREAKVNYVCV